MSVVELVYKETTLPEEWGWLLDHNCRCYQKINFIFYYNSISISNSHPPKLIQRQYLFERQGGKISTSKCYPTSLI